jgi:4-aminobutyrate aminotransferase-like enzyme
MVRPEFRPFPITITGGNNFYVKSGKRYMLDFSGSAMTTGYNFIKSEWLEPTVSRLVFKNQYTDKLKQLLIKTSGFSNVAFSTSGTEACDTALSRYGKPIIALEGAYHGLTFLTKTVSNGTGYDAENKIIHLRCPSNNISVEEAMAYNNELVNKVPIKLNGGTLIMELIQSDGGVNILPQQFIKALFEMAEKFEMHTIVDEVYTGFGRSGEMFLFKKYGIDPEMVCIGKGMAAGLPLGAVLYRNYWDLPYNDVVSMQAGNMFISKVAIEVIKKLDEKRLDFVRTKGKDIIDRLSRIKNSKILSARGKGFMMGVELVDDKGNPDGSYALKIRNRLFKNNVICSLTGGGNHVLKITPPVLIDESSLNMGIEKIVEALEK